MSEDRYQLDLTGRPLEGYQTEEAAASLARLLRISRKRARSLLRGTPSRIKRQLEKDKAIHLMGKVIACGVQCKITQADMLDDNPAVEAGIELQDKLELEIEQPEIELAGEAAEAEMQSQNDAVGGDRIPAQSVSPKVQAPPEVSTADESSEDQPDQSPSAGTIKRGSSASTVRSVAGGNGNCYSLLLRWQCSDLRPGSVCALWEDPRLRHGRRQRKNHILKRCLPKPPPKRRRPSGGWG